MLHRTWLQTVIFLNKKLLFKRASQLCWRPEISQDIDSVKVKIQSPPKDWMQWLAPAPKKRKGKKKSSSSLIFSSVMLRAVPFTHKPVTVRKSQRFHPAICKSEGMPCQPRSEFRFANLYTCRLNWEKANKCGVKKVSAVNYWKWKLNVEGRFVQQWQRKWACPVYWIFIENWIVNVCFVSQTTVPLFVIIYF